MSHECSFQKHTRFGTNNPPYAFPRSYPPPVRPDSISFVTHISLLEKGSRREQRTMSCRDLDECIDAFSRLSLGPSSPRNSHTLPKTVPKPRSRTPATTSPKFTSQLSPSRPRLVSPTLDTSVALSHNLLAKTTCPPPSGVPPRAQNINIPRSNHRRIYSIPYQRPKISPSTPPESPPPPPFPRSIHRTPSLVSDYGSESEASSPSTPPNFPPVPARKGFFPDEPTLSPQHSPAHHPLLHSVDFGNVIYG